MCMLTNGFYTKLPSWLQWITVVSVPRFTLRALLKIEYSWQDTFEVHPMHGLAAFGNPSRYIPAELTGTFQLMTERQMNIMESPHESSPLVEMLVMLGISLSFLLLFAVALMRQVWTLEERCSSPKADGGASATAVDGRDVRESLNSKDHAPTLLEAPRNAWARGAPGKQGQAKQAVAADTAAGRDVRESLNSKDHAPTLLEAPRDAWARGAPGKQGQAKQAVAADTAAGPALSFSAVVPVVTGAEGADISDFDGSD